MQQIYDKLDECSHQFSGSANATVHIVKTSTSDSFTNETRVYSAVKAQEFKDFKEPNYSPEIKLLT